MRNILEEIAGKTRIRVEKLKSNKPLETVKYEAMQMDANTGFPFENELAKDGISFICEVKKASPSKGLIAPDFPYVSIAKDYERSGASAISVLTEPEYFMGSDEYLKEIASAVNIPIIRKDFTVDEYQIYEAKLIGASAVLLICAILSEEQIKKYIKIADSLGLSALVEAHDESEVMMAVRCGARIIGVNNRNLKDFTVDINNSVKLRQMVSDDVIFVSESGIKTHDDIKRLVENKTDAVLIGETFMRSKNKAAQLHELKTGRKTRIKICGLTRDEDIQYVNSLPDDSKPDYIGFVFAKSKRQITFDRAAKLKLEVDNKIKVVGVFVDEDAYNVAKLLNDRVIDIAQLHGNEDNEYISQLKALAPGCEIIKAVKVRCEEDITKASEYDAHYLLLDAYSEISAGGNGETFDWRLITNVKKPFFLAGGLDASNVSNATTMVHPFAVDVSSGVETDGLKDFKRIKEFIENVE